MVFVLILFILFIIKIVGFLIWCRCWVIVLFVIVRFVWLFIINSIILVLLIVVSDCCVILVLMFFLELLILLVLIMINLCLFNLVWLYLWLCVKLGKFVINVFCVWVSWLNSVDLLMFGCLIRVIIGIIIIFINFYLCSYR